MFYGTYKLMMDRHPSLVRNNKGDTQKQAPSNTAARRRACRELLSMSDRQLDDMGFSRELLEQGVKAWPWLVAPETAAVTAATASLHSLPVRQSDAAEVQPQLMNEQRYAA